MFPTIMMKQSGILDSHKPPARVFLSSKPNTLHYYGYCVPKLRPSFQNTDQLFSSHVTSVNVCYAISR